MPTARPEASILGVVIRTQWPEDPCNTPSKEVFLMTPHTRKLALIT